MPFTYSTQFTLSNPYSDSNGNPNPPITLQIPVTDFDFELFRIQYCAPSTSSSGLEGFIPLIDLMLYDNAGIATSSGPVPIDYVVDFTGGNFGRASYVNVHPTPPLVYMNQSKIKFDVYSQAAQGDANLPYTLELDFEGVNRIPCA